MFRNFNLRRAGGGVLILLLLLLLIGVVKRIGDPPASAGGDACEGVEYVGMVPDVDGLAFGPDVTDLIAGFSDLVNTADGQKKLVEAIRGIQAEAVCQYSGMSLALAIHRGLEPWPSSDEDWVNRIQELDGDREAHHRLAGEVLDWNEDAEAEVKYIGQRYNSDWFNRDGDVPVLVTGLGNDPVAGWVVVWTHKDGTVVVERLSCFFQWVDVPECEVNCTPPPPCRENCGTVTTTTLKGKRVGDAPPTTGVKTCLEGQELDRGNNCVPKNSGGGGSGSGDPGNGDSGPGAPGTGVSTPTTSPEPDPEVPDGDNGNTGPISNPDA